MSSPPTVRQSRLERLEALLYRTRRIRRLLFYGSMAFPALVALLLLFLALYPMLFAPAEKLTATLTALVAGGLSFASVSFSASKSRADERNWSLRMAMAGTAMFRFSITLAVALALSVARDRLVVLLGSGTVLDYSLRGLMVLLTATAIVIAFFAFQTMVVLFGPAADEETVARLRRLGDAIDQTEGTP